MGKLRTSIDNVVKTAGTLDKAAHALLDDREKEIDQFMTATDYCRGGAETLYLYLTEKFKKAGSDISQHQKDTIKDFLDSNVGTMLKEILAGQARVQKKIDERDANVRVGQGLKGQVAKLQGELSAIQATIDKKKKKWLQSSKYKAKLKGYEDSVTELVNALNDLDQMLPGKNYGKLVDPNTWKFTASTTVEDIHKGCSTYLTADLKMRKEDDEREAKKFRGRNFAGCLKMLKSWEDEADEMESID